MYAFGQNAYGELCLGDVEERHAPTLVPFAKDKNIIDVVAGNEHTAFMDSEGTIYSSGYNDSGQCGIGHMSRCPSPTPVQGMLSKKIKELHSSNGCEHLCCISDDGMLYTCGYNARGQLGNGTVQSCAVLRPVESLLGRRVTKVACSYYHTVAVVDDNNVYAWGRGDCGQLGIGECTDKLLPTRIESLAGKGVVSVGCGQYHSAFVMEDGTLLTCGKNDFGQLGILDVDLKPTPGVVSLPLSEKFVMEVACGYYHTAAITSEGTLYTFGRNDYGQLGMGHKENLRKPSAVESLVNVHIVQISCGCYHSIALGENGRVYPFGRNNHGQLGTNNTTDSSLPTIIEGLREVKIARIAAGFYHTICLSVSTSRESAVGKLTDRTLASDLRRLLNDETSSDIRFIVEGHKVVAHRCIISSRCEPLDCMLFGAMKESKLAEILIPDQQHKVFLAMLEFLYTDAVASLDAPSLDIVFTLDLLALADQYLIDKLKRLCEAATEKSICIENVCMMLKTADKRGASDLRKTCLEFVLKNFGKVIGTPSFIQLPQEILQEVLFTASKRGVYLRS